MINAMTRCDCERGGNCSKTTVCAVTETRDEYEQILNRVEEQVERIEAILRNDLYRTRVKNALAEIDELNQILKGRP